MTQWKVHTGETDKPLPVRGSPVEPPFGCSARPSTFESAMSGLTLAIGGIERLSDLDETQLTRLRQAVIRLSNAERKASRG